MSAPFFASVGFGCFICANRVLAVITPKTKTAKNYMRIARKAGTIIDVCMGKTMKSVVLFDNGYVLVSHISTATLRFRFSNLHKPKVWDGLEKRREDELGEDDVLDLLDDELDDEDEDEEDEVVEIDEEEEEVPPIELP